MAAVEAGIDGSDIRTNEMATTTSGRTWLP
jgi:hypothetical protein